MSLGDPQFLDGFRLGFCFESSLPKDVINIQGNFEDGRLYGHAKFRFLNGTEVVAHVTEAQETVNQRLFEAVKEGRASRSLLNHVIYADGKFVKCFVRID